MPYATEENLTELAVKQWGKCRSPRLRQIMQSLVKHLHGFAREVDLTQEEWLTAVDWLARTGKLCSDKRQEFILLSDVMGLSMLVDAINHRLPEGATPSTVIGPFHIDDSPELPMGADMAEGLAGETCFLMGTVRDLDGNPIEGRSWTSGRRTPRAHTNRSSARTSPSCARSFTPALTANTRFARSRLRATRFPWTAPWATSTC